MSLEFSLNQTAPAAAAVDCVIVGAFADGSLTPAAAALDAASGGRLKALSDRGDVSGNPKVKIADPELDKVTKEAANGGNRLVLRYFEAAPAPVLTAALSGFDGFLSKPGSYMAVLKDIQKAADMLEAGRTQEVAVRAERRTTVMRLINEQYFVALAISPTGKVGRGRYLLRTRVSSMRDALE